MSTTMTATTTAITERSTTAIGATTGCSGIGTAATPGTATRDIISATSPPTVSTMFMEPACTASIEARSVLGFCADLKPGAECPTSLGYAFQQHTDLVEHLIDLRLLHDQRRRKRDRVGRHAYENAFVERTVEELHGAGPRRTVARTQFDRRHQADIADVDHVGRAT